MTEWEAIKPWTDLGAIGVLLFVLWMLSKASREIWATAKDGMAKIVERVTKSADKFDEFMDSSQARSAEEYIRLLTAIAKQHTDHEVSDEQRFNKIVHEIVDQCAKTRHSQANLVQKLELRLLHTFAKGFKETVCIICGDTVPVKIDFVGSATCAGCHQEAEDAKAAKPRSQ